PASATLSLHDALPIFVVRGWKDREDAVAHEFQGLTLARLDWRDDGVEIIVEKLDHLLARQPVRQGGETAHIGHHDDSAQPLALRSEEHTSELQSPDHL